MGGGWNGPGEGEKWSGRVHRDGLRGNWMLCNSTSSWGLSWFDHIDVVVFKTVEDIRSILSDGRLLR